MRWLSDGGFAMRTRRTTTGPPTFADAQTRDNGDVSVDVMGGRVRDRGTEVSIPERAISEHARRLRLELINGSTEGQVVVCRPEALWGLKLVAARDPDLSDLFAISEEPVNSSGVWTTLERHQTPQLVARLPGIPDRLQSRKIFLDARWARLSRAGGPREETRRWDRFVARLGSRNDVRTFPFDVATGTVGSGPSRLLG